MKKSTKIVIAGGVLLLAGAAGGGYWWLQQRNADPAVAEAAPPKPSTFRYVTLDKVIVMLRTQDGDPMSHYMSVDLVFQAELAQEKSVKEQLPLLRSVAVQALSSYSLQRASALTVDQLASELNAAYKARYAADGIEQPFAEAMIGKLIIE
jgi:flagellar FliL protein